MAQAEWVPYDDVISAQEIGLKDWQEFLDKKRDRPAKFEAQIRAAFPQIQKTLLVRDHLFAIIESYISTAPWGERALSVEKLKKLNEIAYAKRSLDHSIMGPYKIHFEFGEGRFQVNGINATRLAINTGDSIIFNGNALSKKSFSISELTQIWLHELFHADADTITPLPQKDAWAARVAAWVEQRTQTTELGTGNRMTVLDLPPVEVEKIVPWLSKFPKGYGRISFEEQVQEELRHRFLVVHENANETAIVEGIYKAIRTYRDFVGSDFPDWNDLNRQASWPQLKMLNFRKRSDGTIQIEFEQNSLPIQKYQDDTWQKDTPQYSFPRDTSSEPSMPKNRYLVVYNQKDKTTEVRRTFSTPLQDGDFEVNRVQDFKNRRYVSVRVKMAGAIKLLKSGTSVHLIAKDIDSKVNISAVLIQKRIINDDEVLLHFELPQRNLEVVQILIPTQEKTGLYSELNLRPSKVQYLHGAGPQESANLHIQSIEVAKLLKKGQPLIAVLNLQSKKTVVGVTMELQHTLQAVRTRWTGSSPQVMQDELGYVGMGKKYFFDKKNINAKVVDGQTRLSLQIPEKPITQFQPGPIVQRFRSWAYKLDRQLTAQTIFDTRNRSISNVWIHFEDGTNDKVLASKLGVPFSFGSEQEEREFEIEAKRRVEQYIKTTDWGDRPSAEDKDNGKDKTCRSLF